MLCREPIFGHIVRDYLREESETLMSTIVFVISFFLYALIYDQLSSMFGYSLSLHGFSTYIIVVAALLSAGLSLPLISRYIVPLAPWKNRVRDND